MPGDMMGAKGQWVPVETKDEQGAGESNTDIRVVEGSRGGQRGAGLELLGTLTVEPYPTVSEVAQIFRVHAKTIERWRRRDNLPCERLGGVIRYRLSDVLRWASARKEGI